MKQLIALSAILSITFASTMHVMQDHPPADPPQQMMMDMMWMYFWSGNTMQFLFINCTSTNTGQFILGLIICFVGAIAFEFLHFKQQQIYKGTIFMLAKQQERIA